MRDRKIRILTLLPLLLLAVWSPQLQAVGLEDIPGYHTANAYLPSHAAATATEGYPIFTAPFRCEITSILIVPAAAVTGADSNSTYLNLINRGTAGSGTTEIGSYDLTTGNNLATSDEKVLYAPATPLAVSDGNVLAFIFEKHGSGLLVPALLVQVTFRSR